MTNTQKMKAVNFWQQDSSTETFKTTPGEAGTKERNLIPMEILGEVVIMNPDTGEQYAIPEEMIDHYRNKKLRNGS